MPEQMKPAGRAVVLALAMLVCTTLAVPAQEPPLPAEPSAEKGLALAQRLCSSCHLVEGGQTTAMPAGIPSLRGIANLAGQTGQRISNVLIQPHAPMPDLRLTNEEIQHILAYLETLRTNKEGEPLLAPQGTRKPAYPKPS
jgi:mono/diheme cytochrome c family protein